MDILALAVKKEFEKVKSQNGFGYYRTLHEVLFENVAVLTDYDESFGVCLSFTNIRAILISEINPKAKVLWDGVEYNSEIERLDDTQYSFGNEFLGNPNAEDTGEPFLIMFNDELNDGGMVVITAEPTVAHVSVFLSWELPVSIQEEFIPSLQGVVLHSTTEGSGKHFKLTVDDNGTLSVTKI